MISESALAPKYLVTVYTRLGNGEVHTAQFLETSWREIVKAARKLEAAPGFLQARVEYLPQAQYVWPAK